MQATPHRLAQATILSLLLASAYPALADVATTSNSTLVANQQIAKAQAVGVITTFMGKGAQTCDADGKNCHSVFGADDTPDYASLQQTATNTVGVQSFSFLNGSSGQDSNAISAQTGIVAVACGDSGTKIVAGVAIKVTKCTVNTKGDAQITVQTCSAPARGNPVSQPSNAVACSSDPTAANYKPPAGKVCIRPACDTSGVDSLDGWSSPLTLTYQAAMPSTASQSDIANNGLGLSFYPPLNGHITDFTQDSDNMTAIKVVQTFVKTSTNQTAVGLRIAYRHKATVTKAMMAQGPSSVPNPGQHTAAWDTITKLQGNAMIPKLQQKYAANGTNCIQQIQNGVAKDGVIAVCDKNYTNEAGIRPIATTAKVAAEGQDCSSTPQCLKEVVNTNTWTQTCSSDVPLAMRSCETKTDYTLNELNYTRTRKQETCHEQRTQTVNSCVTTVDASKVLAIPRCTPNTWINHNIANAEFGAPGMDRMLVQYYCDPAGADAGAILPLAVTAYGGNGDCGSGWKTINVDFSKYTYIDHAANLSPHWNGYCNTNVWVDVTVTKTCTPLDTECMANIFFYHWVTTNFGMANPDDGSCPPGQWAAMAGSAKSGSYLACFGNSKSGLTTINMDFLRPGINTQYPPPTDACTPYENT